MKACDISLTFEDGSQARLEGHFSSSIDAVLFAMQCHPDATKINVTVRSAS